MSTTELTLLTRTGCHLCDVMRAVVDRARDRRAISLRVVDVDTSPELRERFGAEIPVLLDGDHVVARTRVSVSELLGRLARLKR